MFISSSYFSPFLPPTSLPLVKKVWKDWERTKTRECPSVNAGGTRGKQDMMEIRGKLARRQKVDIEDRLEMYGGLRGGMDMISKRHGPLKFEEKLKP